MSSFEKKHLILSQLADGQFHSGEALGELLGVSRAAVSKHTKQLQQLGLEIFSVSGKGYRLAQPLTLLAHQQICGFVDKTLLPQPHIDVHHVSTSTNDHLLERLRRGDDMPSGTTVVAECQTAGRGRRGRQWVSPFGSHIYYSSLWHLQGIQQAMGLSIAVGLALRDAVQTFVNKPVKVKWPNDLYIEGKKLAGILIELEGQADGVCSGVIGIGINVNMSSKQGQDIDQPWTDMKSHQLAALDRNHLIAQLMVKLHQQMDVFVKSGLKPLVDEWNQHDHFYQQPMTLLLGSRQVMGIGQGIDNQGGILLLDENTQQTNAYYGGEISLRGRQ